MAGCAPTREIVRGECYWGYQIVTYAIQMEIFGVCVVVDTYWTIEECEEGSK